MRFFSRVALAGVLGLVGLHPGASSALIAVGAFDTYGAADVDVVGDLAYVADQSSLRVIDVSDPAAPVEIGALDARSVVLGVAVEGDLAYLAEGTYRADDFDGLRVIDVSNPAVPVEIGSLRTPDQAIDVQVVGDLAFVTAGTSGLRVIDVSDPSAPIEIGALLTPDTAMSVTLVGDLAYVADLTAGVGIIDVSDPTALREIGTYAMPSGTYQVEVVGNLAYVACDIGLYVLDVSDPANPVEVGSPDSRWWATHVQVVGDLAYVVGYHSGLRVIDVSDPSARRELSFFLTPGGPVAIQVVGDLAYVADTQRTTWPPNAKPEAALRVIDVSNPSAPAELASLAMPEFTEDVEVVGDLAYVVGRWDSVLVFDVSNPTSPVLLGAPYEPYEATGGYSRPRCPDWAEDIEIVGELAYVVNCGVGLEILDLSDPGSPVILGTFSGLSAHDVEVAGDLAFVAGETGLYAVDVSDPTTPVLLGRCVTGGIARDVEVIGGLAYVAAGVEGLRIIDVSDPGATLALGALDARDYSYDVEVAGDRAYMTDLSQGLRIIDVSDPATPVEIGASEPLWNAIDVEIVGDLAYVYAGGGVYVIDVSDPAAPREIGARPISTTSSGRHRDVEVVGTRAFLAQGWAGLGILDFGPEYHTAVAIDIEPGSAVNRINLMRGGFVSVAILGSERFDVADVDAATLAFGPAGAAPVEAADGRIEDTNADGFTDLVLDFRTEETGIAFGDTQACIIGETREAVPIGGCDATDVLGPSFTPPGRLRPRLRGGARAAAATVVAPAPRRLMEPGAQVR